VRDGPFRDVDVFVLTWVFEWRDEVKIAEIEAEEGSSWCGDDTVEEKLGSGEVCCRGVGFSLVINKVAADGETDAVWIGFLGTVVGAYP
jgi:hypothetical protein